MQVIHIRTIWGPSVFHNKPLIRMRLDIAELERSDSSQLPAFVERLLNLLPGLREHRCSKGYRGGFVERLRTGTWMAHIVEHIALELSESAGIPVGYGKTVSTDKAGIYDIYVRFQNEAGMREVLGTAVDLAEALLAGSYFPLPKRLEYVCELISGTALGPTTAALVEAAERRGIPVRRLNSDNLVRLGYGCRMRKIEAALSDRTSHLGVEIAGDKDLTRKLLQDSAIPVPDGHIVRDCDQAIKVARQLGYPVVVKPLDANHGRGVSVDVRDDDQVIRAFSTAREHSSRIVIEEMFHGRDFRVLVVNGQMTAASERVPAHVIGDGVHTIAELIEIENMNPLRGDSHEKPLTKLCADKARTVLARKGLSITSLPEKDTVVTLAETANISTGGVARDVTEQVHGSVRLICERAARVIGLDIAGIDLTTPDITQPIPDHAGIIEVNAGPGLRMHHYPTQGMARDAAGSIIDMLFPNGDPGRIPTVAITGTNGKTTVARMIECVLSKRYQCVGLTTTEGIWIGGNQVAAGDTTGPSSAQVVLSDPTVEAAVLETARGGIVRSGLGYDWTDVGIILNIQPDHIGQDGIQNLEDILRIKSLVAERVREGGTVVLNADDPLLATLMDRAIMKRTPPKQVVYFSTSEHSALIQAHLAGGGTAFTLMSNILVECVGNRRTPLGSADGFASTLAGTARFQIANLLAAIAACRALGIGAEPIVSALAEFGGVMQNRGRVNLYKVNGGHVIVDYGHNLGAFQAICDMIMGWKCKETIGVVSLPGDRSDALLEQAARVAGCGFDQLIIREDSDRRGRAVGAIASRLYQGIKKMHPALEPIVIIDELESFRYALRLAGPNKVVVLFYDKYDILEQALGEVGALPTEFRPEWIVAADDRKESAAS